MSNFDKSFNRLSGLIVAAWVLFFVFDLAIIGVIIWAIIKLVNHFA